MNQERAGYGWSDPTRAAHIARLRAAGAAGISALVEELVEPAWAARRAAVAALAESEPAVMATLLSTLRDDRKNEAKIAGLVDALSTTRNDIDGLLLELGGNDDVAVLCDVAQILGRRESARAVPFLARLTKHADDNVALAAVEALGRIGSEGAIDALLPLIETRNFFRTFPTIDVLGRSGDSRAFDALLPLVGEPVYASEAVRALGRLGDMRAVPVLLDHVLRANASAASGVALSLVAIHEASERQFGTSGAVPQQLVTYPRLAELSQKASLALKRADPAEQLALGEVLSWVDEQSSIPVLLGLLSASTDIAQPAAQSLKRLGAAAEPRLIDALLTGNAELRRMLIPLLSGKQAARDGLIACLGDEDPTVRALSCDALARTSDTAAVPAIFRLLSDPDTRVSQAALAALQSLGCDQTRQLTLEAAQSNDPRLCRAALRIIGYFGYPEGLLALLEGCQSADEKLRDAAISGLPFIEAPRALAMLIETARHSSARTRTAAVRALGHTSGAPEVLSELRRALADSDAWVRYYACQALGRLHDDASTELFAALLGDGAGQVRVAAVEALAKLRGAPAFDVLVSVLDTTDADLHRAALVALGISKRPAALPMLASALSSSDAATRLVALSSLAELGVREALPFIAQAVRDPDEGVRVAATGYLGEHRDPAATLELLASLAENPGNQPLIGALSRPLPGRCEEIERALSSADDSMAAALVGALSRMRTEESLDTLRRELRSPNDSTRRAAAAALTGMQDAASAEARANAALQDPDAEVRRICASSLVR